MSIKTPPGIVQHAVLPPNARRVASIIRNHAPPAPNGRPLADIENDQKMPQAQPALRTFAQIRAV